MKIALARLEKLPEVVAQMVKPAEKIDTIRIHQVSGLGAAGGAGGGAGGDKPPVNQALDSIMGMAVQLPALKKIGEELGVSMDKGVAGLADSLTDPAPAPEDTAKIEAAPETDVPENAQPSAEAPKKLPAAE